MTPRFHQANLCHLMSISLHIRSKVHHRRSTVTVPRQLCIINPFAVTCLRCRFVNNGAAWWTVCFTHKNIIHPSSTELISLRFCRGNINTTASTMAGGRGEMAQITVIKRRKWGGTKTNRELDLVRRYELCSQTRLFFFYSLINFWLGLYCRGDNGQQSLSLASQ